MKFDLVDKIPSEWKEVLEEEFVKSYFDKLRSFVASEYESYVVYPKYDDLFKALEFVKPADVSVVLLGQDPYHEFNQAHGLAFSVPLSQKTIPCSLRNVFKELHDDLGVDIPDNGNLERWAKQGVLMLNTILTVREKVALSHEKKGWEELTDAIIRYLNSLDKPIVFLLWGNGAKSKEKMLNNPKHLILKASHPSFYSANKGFFGCRHFSKANEFLISNGLKPIDF
ncbi:MAG: uracil-DNA glycosylase [Lachnospiraceae bacterium]|nr:uracil-DNA glycosylase [Lachnospiraceae bacterium]